ncbi:MAG: CoB--CoM heterodisulfide reductase iron-sulfur subunit B family protein [Kiritimatiellia bacterium]|jgi:heterodisulfide reductase subunit B|nr:CoB--CoM heterodisulfide reductase iron-sulfur subunit B family protein [Kiritimatiellia bacterium]
MKYAFFPGCSLESTAWDLDKSARAVCKALEIELIDIPGWSCCGSTPAHVSNASLATALPAMNLQKAADMGMPITTVCASCYGRLRVANQKINDSDEERERVGRIIGKPYDGKVEVHHLLDVIVNKLGSEAVADKVERKLSGMKVACYYGCLLSRPPEAVAFDNPEHPSVMEKLVAMTGAEAIEWPYKTECCGASLSISNSDVVGRLSHRLLSMVRRAGAECVVVACPLCQVNLDLRQADATAAHGKLPETPILYFTQLLGLALGLPEEELGLEALMVSAAPLLSMV